MKKEKKKTGRPRKKIDWEVVDSLCKMHCTGEEIAEWLHVDYDTLNNAIKDKFGKSFSEYYATKSLSGNVSLRRKVWSQALTQDNWNAIRYLCDKVLYPESKTSEEDQLQKTIDAMKSIADIIRDAE